ncbi:hypothetical protein BpHYR1_051094 [Brachionus plicatilis]|uniref:Uncharacterized protein n=1 Tax=Brachionus plicatilis TaxID=10195 RepID=A0A3M7QFT6_BRAPC|nr:hypothetical protein BpHYR1_051094 [Brachionus plicatilis]
MPCVLVQCIKLVVSGIDAALNTCFSIFRDLGFNAASKVNAASITEALKIMQHQNDETSEKRAWLLMQVLNLGHEKFKNTCLDHALNFECHMFNAAFIRTALRRGFS